MFKKSSKRNLRARKTSDDDGAEDALERGPQIVNAGMLKAERKKKKKKEKGGQDSTTAPSKQSVLSFDQEDEEETTFQLKKPSRSKRIAKHIKRIAQEEKERNQNEGNKYTAEALNELKALSVQPQVFENTAHAEDNTSNSNTSFTLNQSGSFYDLKPGEIPDANRIHAARKQREMMRKYGAEYIPVENGSNSTALREQHDPDGNSSDEDGPMVEMKGIIDDSIRVAGEIGCEGESALKRDYEFDEWEAEMIKKGISTQQFALRNEQTDAAASPAAVSNDFVRSATGSFNGAFGGNQQNSRTHRATLQSMSPAETIKSVKGRISSRLENIQQTNRARKMDFDRANTDIEMSEDSAKKMGDLTTMSNQYMFFQDVKAYIADLLDCLSEKNADITAWEESMHKTWKERANMFVSRRQQDVRDESEDITLSMSNSKVNPKPTDHIKLTRVREREARRTRRRAKRQISGNAHAYINGLSTDDEESSTDLIKWTSERDRICNSAQTIFNDVVDEFCDVNTILSRFLEWKEKFPESYSDAYIGLCLPKLIMPYIKLQILSWNPLLQDAVPLEEMLWYKKLLFHGTKSDSAVDNNADSDDKLLSGLFEKLIVPKLTFFVGEVWDPLSRVQSHRLSMLLCRFLRIYPCMRAENKKCNDLLVNLCARIQQAIESDAFIPIYPTTALSNVMSGPGAFFERQTWTCIKLFQNIFLFEGILSKDTLIELAFTSLLNRYIMLSLQISPATTALVHKCSCIVDAIPSRWLSEIDELANNLEPFSRYLLHIAKLIHSELHRCTAAEERKAKDCIGHIGKMLSRIGSYEMCQEIAELLGINI